MQKITPFLWFDGKAASVIPIIRPARGGRTASGTRLLGASGTMRVCIYSLTLLNS